jgi:hypothetical protein
MTGYLPGQSVRSSVTATLFGVGLADPSPAPVLTVHCPDGTLLTPSVVRDSVGAYHADFTIPISARPGGQGVMRWRAAGADPADTGIVETLFTVQTLGY